MESGMGYRLDLNLFIFLLLYLLRPAITYNLDTKSPIIFRGSKNTYFGYSVGLQENLNNARLLVGAPKNHLNQRDYFYQCIIGQRGCQTLLTVNSGDIGSTYKWFGVAVDTNPQKENNFIVCSHRNITTAYDKHGAFYEQTGSCFEVLGSKINVLTKPRNKATAGISARYSQDGNSIIIGAPTHGTGARGGYILKNSQWPANDPQDTVTLAHAYAGYAVNMVDNKIILGIPRYQHYGAIKVEGELITAPQNKFTFGSYFGSAIAVGDVNGDGQKDVIVGAPFYSETYPEEGRVYIFHAIKSTFNTTANVILSIPTYRSRFGATLAVADFNNDNYNDLLVGAPYENNGIGCIYLFNGDRNKLEKTPSQRIEGTKINSDIKSFGISFSRPVDIDKNGYPDIAVGAYLSDRAVVIQSRPVVKLQASLAAKPRMLQSFLDPIWQTSEAIIVNVTLFMYFQNGRFDLVLNTNLKVDVEEPASRKRVYLEDNLKEFADSEAFSGSFFYKDYQIKVKNKISSLKPIKFTLDYYLPNNGYSTHCTLCPLLKSGNLSTVVKFNLSCGMDDICNTYFNLDLWNPSSSLLLSGERKYITILAIVENVEEHAYNTKAHVYFPSWLEYMTVWKYNNSVNNVTCSVESTQHKLTCFLGYPMREKSTISFMLKFIVNWMPIPKDLEVNMSVTTDSIVSKENLNKTASLTIHVKNKSVLKLFGKAETDLYIHKSTSVEEAVINHIFILENAGPSEAQNLVFETSVPHLVIRNMTVMTLDFIKYDGMHDQNSSDVCTSIRSNYSEDDVQRIKKDIMERVTYDCSWMHCIKVTCNFKELKKHRSKNIEIKIVLENRYLDSLKGKMLNIFINTTGKLKQEYKDYIIKVPDVQKTITTRVFIKPLKPTLKWWIPVASILSGILLMVLVSILLYEGGFFRRYTKLEEEKVNLNPDGTENEKPEENENKNNIEKEGN